jgi:hypothetical protein
MPDPATSYQGGSWLQAHSSDALGGPRWKSHNSCGQQVLDSGESPIERGERRVVRLRLLLRVRSLLRAAWSTKLDAT